MCGLQLTVDNTYFLAGDLRGPFRSPIWAWDGVLISIWERGHPIPAQSVWNLRFLCGEECPSVCCSVLSPPTRFPAMDH